ncbi:ATP-dependent RNA helicase, putative [Plasmodium gallinaceum]|uniref:ATP-dependent RNA helicase n=1 Tax=Plasmodium gallinaceum TaxID=5849 RepID=A0A1J1GTT2_PLAGA|nr:ATP-dependent RNA helicase, putative [Plasmodium gallinaceum]CRG95705.1 ATP-dependent RNA helicase, putative [Plasmodium gallinaceum]
MKEEKKKTLFTELNLDEPIIFSLFIQKYIFCANIQKKTIPHLLKKKNILLHSETGSGKTLCFVIPLLQHLISYKKISLTNFAFNKNNEESFLYNQDSIKNIYDFFENVDVEKCNSTINLDISKFIYYNKNILENNNLCIINKNKDNEQVDSINRKNELLRSIDNKCLKKDIKNKIICKFYRKKKNEIINVYGIIITPTRELCIQIYNLINKFLFFIRLYFCHKCNIEFKTLNKDNFFLNSLLFRGAVKIKEDLKIIRNEKKKKNRYQIIISTPGKLSVLLNKYKKYFNTNQLKYLVLDEGDKLLEESYINHIKDIIKSIFISDYSTCICSATCLNEEKFYSLFLHKKKNFIKCINKNDIVIDHFQLPEKIENYYIVLRNIDKSFFLFKFLNTVVNDKETVIVFFSTCFCVEYFFHIFKNVFNTERKNKDTNYLKILQLNSKYKIYDENEIILYLKMISYIKKYIGNKKFVFLKIHRKMKDKKRISAYKKITDTKSNKRKIIFCTDVMSRGINIDVHWVVNYDVPNKNITYVHRSGRTGRFNKNGKNIILLNKKEKEYIFFLRNKNVHITNFEKTVMYINMMNYEKILMKNENNMNEDALKIIKKKKKVISNKISFFKFYKNYYSETEKEKDKGYLNKKQTAHKKENIILLNNMIMLFLKYLIFFVIEYREIFLLSTKAFLSYIEFYKNHQLNFLLSFNKLNLAHLCYAFALVKIPKFKEKYKIKNFKKININTFEIPYKNEEKEKKRQDDMKNKENMKKKQISTIQKKGENNDKKEKQKKKRKTIVQKKHEKREMEENEIDSLFFEERLYKKLKKKKITEDEYDRLLNMDKLDKIFSSNINTSKNMTIQNKNILNTNRKKNKKKQKVYNLKIKKRSKNKRR